MSDAVRRAHLDRIFLLLLTPLMASALPSVLYCLVGVLTGVHGMIAGDPIVLHVPAENLWDRCFLLQTHLMRWILEWNALATLAATAFFVFTLLRPRWRYWTGLALIPYGLLLCADFTMRWHSTMLP